MSKPTVVWNEIPNAAHSVYVVTPSPTYQNWSYLMEVHSWYRKRGTWWDVLGFLGRLALALLIRSVGIRW